MKHNKQHISKHKFSKKIDHQKNTSGML